MRTIECQRCGVETPKRGNGPQKYCEPCSNEVSRERRTQWARNNKQEFTPHRAALANARKEQVIEAGKARSKKESIAWYAEAPEMDWTVRIKVPFSYSASKNHIYAMRGDGHVALRKESRAMRQAIALKLKNAIHGQPVVQRKLYLDIFVEKPNHRGDAVNVIDLVSDAVEDATGLDDRWYCIRRLDWAINKNSPQLMIGIAQDGTEPMQVCSHCGVIQPYDQFNKAKSAKNGIGRACKSCRRDGRKSKVAVQEIP